MLKPRLLFKGTLLGIGGNQWSFRFLDDEGFILDDEDFWEEDDEEDCPTIRVSKREKARLHRPWRQTLIIKLMGRLVGYSYLARSLKTLWKPKSLMEIVAIDNKYFLAKFEYVEDYNLQSTRGLDGFKPLSHCEEVGSYFLPQF